jgi:hypothetical protein
MNLPQDTESAEFGFKKIFHSSLQQLISSFRIRTPRSLCLCGKFLSLPLLRSSPFWLGVAFLLFWFGLFRF